MDTYVNGSGYFLLGSQIITFTLGLNVEPTQAPAERAYSAINLQAKRKDYI